MLRALVLCSFAACAHVDSSTEVRFLPAPAHLPPISERVEVVWRGYQATWEQRGDRLSVTLTEHRRCRRITMVPVIREERTIRKVDRGSILWEYGVAAISLGIATYAYTRPEAFSSPLINEDGEILRERGPGYFSAGLFTGIGALALTAAVIDTVRSRDLLTYSDAVERREGADEPCPAPVGPWADHRVELVVADEVVEFVTDERGAGRVALPPLTADTAAGPLPAALRIDSERAVAIDLVFPYDAVREPAPPHLGATPPPERGP